MIRVSSRGCLALLACSASASACAAQESTVTPADEKEVRRIAEVMHGEFTYDRCRLSVTDNGGGGFAILTVFYKPETIHRLTVAPLISIDMPAERTVPSAEDFERSRLFLDSKTYATGTGAIQALGFDNAAMVEAAITHAFRHGKLTDTCVITRMTYNYSSLDVFMPGLVVTYLDENKVLRTESFRIDLDTAPDDDQPGK